MTLVSGGAGFVGLAVSEALLAAGHDVVVFDARPLPVGAMSYLAQYPGTLRVVQADVCDPAAVKSAMAGAHRMVVAAAVTCGPVRERQMPEQVIAVNVAAVATAVRLAAEAGLHRVVHLSSVAVYGARPDTVGPLSEDTACRPQGLYGITKLAGESVALRLSGVSGLDLVAARLGACFGPWEHDTGVRDTLSPQHQILTRVQRGEAVSLDQDAVRDWLYVRDAASAILALLDAAVLPHPVYNIGPGTSFALSAWCAALGHPAQVAAGHGADVQSWGARPPLAIGRLTADTAYRPRFGAARSAADWLQFLDLMGDGILADRSWPA